MPATDALTLRTAFTEQLELPKFRSLVDRYARREEQALGGANLRRAREYDSGALERALSIAETYYLSPDMQQFAQLAAEDFPDDEAILKEDLPSEAGFLYLPQRIPYRDIRSRVQQVYAIIWCNNRGWLLTDRQDPDDEISRKIRELIPDDSLRSFRATGRWDVNGAVEFVFGQPIPSRVVFPRGVIPERADVTFQKRPDAGTAMLVDGQERPDIYDLADLAPDELLRFLLAVWRLMQQTLAAVEHDQSHPRATRRRAERKHIPTGVTVISLRRRAGHYEGTGQSINYRTLVRGHWRRVWCGPKDGERYRRAVYIHEFIRGPEDAPLIIRKRVNALVR